MTALPVPTTRRIKFLSKDRLFENFSWVLLVIVMILGAALNPTFLTTINLTNLLLQSVVLGILVLAESICLISGHFDLSIVATLTFVAVVGAWTVSSSTEASGWLLNPALAIPFMLLLGAVIGLVNGFMVSYIGMNPFITTLATSIILLGWSVVVAQGRTIYPLTEGFNYVGQAKIGGLPVSVLVLLALYGVMHVVLSATGFGRRLYAVGGNSDAARASGINVRAVVLGAYVVSGTLCAVAAWILAGRLNSAGPNMTGNILLFAFAAAVLGGVALSGGEGRVTGVLGGVLLFSAITNILNLVRISPFIIDVVTGAIILLAMLIATVKDGNPFRRVSA